MDHAPCSSSHTSRRQLAGHRAIVTLADDLRVAGEGATEADMLRNGWTADQLERYGKDAAKAARRLASPN